MSVLLNTMRQRRSLAIFFLIAGLAFSFASPAVTPAQPQAKRAIIISLDGLDVRYLKKRDEYGLKIPTLRRLMKDGVMAQVVGVYPSVTYPSHTSIVTGTTPERHGIYGSYSGDALTPGKLKGQHGFLPSRYYTSFIASGAGIGRRGQLGTIRLIDEGPTIARLLGFKLRHAVGRALPLER